MAGEDGSLQALDLSADRPLIVSNFSGLMQRWLDQYFLADNFVSKAGYLKLHLDQLEAGSGNSLTELEDLTALVDDLQAAIALTNRPGAAARARTRAGYRDFLDKVGTSSLLGPQVQQDSTHKRHACSRVSVINWIARRLARQSSRSAGQWAVGAARASGEAR